MDRKTRLANCDTCGYTPSSAARSWAVSTTGEEREPPDSALMWILLASAIAGPASEVVEDQIDLR